MQQCSKEEKMVNQLQVEEYSLVVGDQIEKISIV
jgi:hypothetical protein